MPLTADQFAQAVVSAGLSSADELAALTASLANSEQPIDAHTLAARLVERQRLTKFQAEELLAGSQTPLVLGDYVLLDKIGAGGMGQVFKAQHRHMKRLVAIKLLPPALTQDEEAIKRFQREVEAAARLSHPNIVQAYDASVQRGVWYLVMEYVAGQDLASLVRERPLPVAEAIDYVRQAARGLAYAHENGVVHRDIKPANLLLDKKGTVKILDMGLARFDDAAAIKDGLTQSGQVMGTIDFMAPEQAFDIHSADARADIYSLGCTLFRLITGRNVFAGDSLVKKLMAHQTQPIPSLREHCPAAPLELAQLFERMVAKRPEERFQTMSDVGVALDHFARVVPPGTSGDASLAARSSPLEVNRSALATQAPASSIDVAEIAPTVSLASPQHGTDPVSDRSIQVARESVAQVSSRSTSRWRPSLMLIASGFATALLCALGIFWFTRNREPTRIAIPARGSAALVTIPVEIPVPPPVPRVPFVAPAASEAAPRVFGGGLLLDQRSNFIDLSEVTYDGSHDLTIEGWFKTLEFAHCEFVRFEPDGPVIFAMPKGQKGEIGAEWKDRDGKEVYAICIERLRVGQVQHVALVYRDQKMLMFVDGVPIAESEVGIQPGVIRKLKISNALMELYGLRISNRCRYAEPFVPESQFTNDEGTIALYSCVDGRGNLLRDASGKERHGKIRGGQWHSKDGTLPAVPEPLTMPLSRKEAQMYQAAWAVHLDVPTESENSLQGKLKLIPPGEFKMGRSAGDGDIFIRDKLTGDDLPAHTVTLTKPYWISATEVTQAQWQQVMGTTPWRGKQQAVDDPARPATYVSWKDAAAFCQKLSEQEKVRYRLPTEAEWEWACRAGTETAFSFGDSPTSLTEYAWGRSNSQDQPQPVGTKKPNPWDLFDMHGNAWEWCADEFAPYSAADAIDPLIQGEGDSRTQRVLRGGCFWSVPLSDYRSAARRAWPEGLGYSESGFRIVREIEPRS
jgi:serine/threonine protein kinase/formylglycine-generating enzyme required for sulfatase activity